MIAFISRFKKLMFMQIRKSKTEKLLDFNILTCLKIYQRSFH